MTTQIPEALTARQQASLSALAAELDRLHVAMRGAVEAGLSVELRRSSRYHCGTGHWGDLLRPVVVSARA